MNQVYLYATGGLADILRQIYLTCQYSKKNNLNKIYLETQFYNPSNIFDFFKFDFDITITNKKNNLKYKKIIGNSSVFCKCSNKQCVYSGTEKFATSKQTMAFIKKIKILKNEIDCFYDNLYGSLFALKSMTIKDHFKNKFINYLHDNFGFEEYIAVHIRSTDRSHEYNRYGFENINHYVDEIARLINASSRPAYISTDDYSIVERLQREVKRKISFNKSIFCKFNKNLHSSNNANILENAIIDLLMLAESKDLIYSVGGFSRLAFFLWQNNLIGSNKEKGNCKKIIRDQVFENFNLINKKYNSQKLL
jgi:hypothetical protein